MNLDIRLPMGMLFTVIGVLLAVYGVMADESIYQKSLGFNVNLYWGLVLIVFGGLMFVLGIRGAQRPSREAESANGD